MLPPKNKIEIVYEPTCPNYRFTESKVRKVAKRMGVKVEIVLINRDASSTPPDFANLPSPSVLVNGVDLEPNASKGAGCRIYQSTEGKITGSPPESLIEKGLESLETHHRSGTLPFLSVLPAFGAALLPALGCPLCWPLYAALTASLGIGFINYTPYLPGILIGTLLVALAGLFIYGLRSQNWITTAAGSLTVIAFVGGRALSAEFVYLLPGLFLGILTIGLLLKSQAGLKRTSTPENAETNCDC